LSGFSADTSGKSKLIFLSHLFGIGNILLDVVHLLLDVGNLIVDSREQLRTHTVFTDREFYYPLKNQKHARRGEEEHISGVDLNLFQDMSYDNANCREGE